MIFSIIILLSIFFYLGVSCGASWPWSSGWQVGFKRRVPEIISALIMGGMASSGYHSLGLEGWWLLSCFMFSSVIAFAGIEAATWSFLQWGKENQTHTPGREFTLMPLVDLIAKQWGWKLGDEGYSWTAATVKGTIITLPAGGLGGLFFAAGYEVGSHANKYLKINSSIISEGLSFAFVGVYYMLFLKVVS